MSTESAAPHFQLHRGSFVIDDLHDYGIDGESIVIVPTSDGAVIYVKYMVAPVVAWNRLAVPASVVSGSRPSDPVFTHFLVRDAVHAHQPIGAVTFEGLHLAPDVPNANPRHAPAQERDRLRPELVHGMNVVLRASKMTISQPYTNVASLVHEPVPWADVVHGDPAVLSPDYRRFLRLARPEAAAALANTRTFATFEWTGRSRFDLEQRYYAHLFKGVDPSGFDPVATAPYPCLVYNTCVREPAKYLGGTPMTGGRPEQTVAVTGAIFDALAVDYPDEVAYLRTAGDITAQVGRDTHRVQFVFNLPEAFTQTVRVPVEARRTGGVYRRAGVDLVQKAPPPPGRWTKLLRSWDPALFVDADLTPTPKNAVLFPDYVYPVIPDKFTRPAGPDLIAAAELFFGSGYGSSV